MSRRIFLLVFLLCLFIGNVNAQNVTSLNTSCGSSYINWSWSRDNITQLGVWVDGDFVVNSSLTYYVLSNLEPREQHTIDLCNVTNSSCIYATDEARTLYPYTLYYILFLLSLGFLLLEILFSRNAILCVLFGVFCFFISMLTFYFSFTYYLPPLSYILLGIAFVAVVWLVGKAFTMLSGKNEYESEEMT